MFLGCVKCCYHGFDAAPVFDKRFPGRLDVVHDFVALLNPEEEFADQFNAVVNVCAVCHSLSELDLSFNLAIRTFSSLAKLQVGTEM